ncbi:MAG: DMT family transporter [Deltaproteobacteria bacterium]|nr:DMT family transporter [Deltaproteobacteria bacterium]
MDVGTVWMVGASVFYGAMNISVKMSGSYLTIWQTAIGRFAFGVILILILARPLKLELSGHGRWLLMGRGLAGTGSFLLLVLAFERVPLSMAMVLFYLWHVFACLLSSKVAGEPMKRRDWPFVIGALCGTTLIMWPDHNGPGISMGHFFALGASFLSGLAVILTRRLGRTNDPFTLYFYFCLMGAFFCIVPLMAQETPILPSVGAGWAGLGAVALFAMAAQVMLNQGMKYLKASKTGVLMMIEVIVAAGFGVIYLGEPFNSRLACGAVLILGCGVALIMIPEASRGIQKGRVLES